MCWIVLGGATLSSVVSKMCSGAKLCGVVNVVFKTCSGAVVKDGAGWQRPTRKGAPCCTVVFRDVGLCAMKLDTAC